jgi:hypothetical protein
MKDNPKVIDRVYALRETEKGGALFKPVIETANLIWTLKISEIDKLGILLDHLEIKAKNTPSLPLGKQSEILKNKITYLEEDFSLIEDDRNSRTMVLRSNLPRQLENTISYYEILLRGGDQLSFDRYEFDKITGQRQTRPANLARETFERLLSDFESLFS